MPTGRNVICIGASAGGLQPLRELIADLPRDLPASVFVVVHTGRDNAAALGYLLRKTGALPVDVARDGLAIERSRIYVTPPDRHLIVKPGRMRVVRGGLLLDNHGRPRREEVRTPFDG